MAGLFTSANSVDLVAYTSAFHAFDWRKVEGQFKTLCPFHGDTSPSLSYNKAKNKVKCFTCDTPSYSVVDFVSVYLGIEPKEAALLICEDMDIIYDENKRDLNKACLV